MRMKVWMAKGDEKDEEAGEVVDGDDDDDGDHGDDGSRPLPLNSPFHGDRDYPREIDESRHQSPISSATWRFVGLFMSSFIDQMLIVL